MLCHNTRIPSNYIYSQAKDLATKLCKSSEKSKAMELKVIGESWAHSCNGSNSFMKHAESKVNLSYLG